MKKFWSSVRNRPCHPGAWPVRVERRMTVAEKDYDLYVLKAILVLPWNSAWLKI
jgi:hypothetical protein